MQTGSVDLPLHPGRCPAWLFVRMRALAHELSEIIINNYGTREFLSRISDPMFFQALGCCLAYDWHSSGTTTTACGALKEAISLDMGIAVTGGKGRISRNTPDEIEPKADYFSLNSAPLQKASFLSAKVDSSCIQAGYHLYHHSFFFDDKGNWAVVQQGMNNANHYARRYHWFNSETFVNDPKDEIAGIPESEALNLVSKESKDAREVSVDLINDNPIHLQKYFNGQTTLFDYSSDSEAYSLPERHEILPCDLTRKDWEMLQRAYEFQPQNYEELVCLSGMGGKKLRALALLAKLIHGTKLDWKDPVKYSFAHGGKDGIPYSVNKDTYENSISFLRDVVMGMRDGSTDKEKALRSLARMI